MTRFSFCLLLKITALQDDVVFPEPEDLCERILKAYELENHHGWHFIS